MTATPSDASTDEMVAGICGRPVSEKPTILLVVGYPQPGCQMPVHAGVKKPLVAMREWLDAAPQLANQAAPTPGPGLRPS